MWAFFAVGSVRRDGGREAPDCPGRERTTLPVLYLYGHNLTCRAMLQSTVPVRVVCPRGKGVTAAPPTGEICRFMGAGPSLATAGLSESTLEALKGLPGAAQKELLDCLPTTSSTQPEMEPAKLNLVFLRHAECMHTAAAGIPSAILPKFMDAATKASVEPLVTKFDGVRSTSEGEWKQIAGSSPFSVMSKADTPLLPSELAAGTHKPRLNSTLDALGDLPFISASPPLLRMKLTAAITHEMRPTSSGLSTCQLSTLLLPRPSPLHTPEDVRAYATAADEALAHLEAGGLAADTPELQTVQSVVGAVSAEDEASVADAKLRASAVTAAMKAYTAMDASGGFVPCDEPAEEAASAGGGSAAEKFARWAFGLAAKSGCSNLVVFGGSGWWAGLVNELGTTLPDEARDALLPSLVTDASVLNDGGEPIALPLMPPPAGARFVSVVRGPEGFSLALPTAAQAEADGDAFSAKAAALNPGRPADGVERDDWLRGLLADGQCCTY